MLVRTILNDCYKCKSFIYGKAQEVGKRVGEEFFTFKKIMFKSIKERTNRKESS